MRKPTPVTTPSMMRVRWSTVKAKSTWKPVTAIQLYPKGRLTMVMDSDAPAAFMAAQSQATSVAGGGGERRGGGGGAGAGRGRPAGPRRRETVRGSGRVRQR